MDRRVFIKGALIGLVGGRVSIAGAQTDAPVASPVGSISPNSTMALMGLPTKASLVTLIDRARAALDVSSERFLLRDRIAVADFSLASSQLRFHIVDLVAGKAVSYLVAHGLGSDPTHSGFLQTFSNEPGSEATSEGAYLTSEIYDGTHGPSMRLIGLDATNNNAEIRAIVVHAAPYVSEDHIAVWGKAGRSNGCFAVAPHLITQVLGLLGPGRLLFAAKA